MCVGALKGGYGGDIHNIGCHVIPQSSHLEYQYGYPADQSAIGSETFGPTHSDTVHHSDVEMLEASVGQHRLTGISVYYSDV
mmetsp:Transcript_43347/g.50946  ORF Transcript_43347/g.50946 Transcript_43347/m.50946 type:complete len:82 (+) Transcript_43347:399-644(+)